jgi:transcription-repair coupling factor (superfamily II helicase)
MPDIAVSSQSTPPVALVKAGQRFAFDGTHGSSDALLIARYHLAYREQVPLLAVVCASAVDAQRLTQEIAFFAPEARVRLLPDWETLPYDTFSPHQDLVSERLATLHDLGEGRCDILLVPATTALYRMPPASFMAAYTFSFTQGARLDETKLKSQLTLAGYEHVSQVVRPGEYCVRGSLIDLFPMGSPLPYRIDLFDDQVDSIRAFDPDTQRSLYPVRDVRLLPGREFPFDETARTAFRSRWREVFEGDPSRASIYKDIGNGVPSAGIEYYLPLFFEDTATLFHYLPDNAQLAFVGDLDAATRNASFSPTKTSSRSRSRSRASCCRATRAAAGRRRCRTSRSTVTPRTRSPRCARISTRRRIA